MKAKKQQFSNFEEQYKAYLSGKKVFVSAARAVPSSQLQGRRASPLKNPERALRVRFLRGANPCSSAAAPGLCRSLPGGGAFCGGAASGAPPPSLYFACAPGGGGCAPTHPPGPPPAARSCFVPASSRWGACAPLCVSPWMYPRQYLCCRPRGCIHTQPAGLLCRGAAKPPPADDADNTLFADLSKLITIYKYLLYTLIETTSHKNAYLYANKKIPLWIITTTVPISSREPSDLRNLQPSIFRTSHQPAHPSASNIGS